MGALSFDGLLRSLTRGREPPAPVYYLHGDDDVLKDEAVQALVDRVLDPGGRDFNFDQRAAADLDAAAFHALVNTPPLLAARRAVVIRGLEDLKPTSQVRRQLERYLASPNPTTLLVLVQGAGAAPDAGLTRAATPIAVEPLPPERVLRWVSRRASQLALALDPRAAELLIATLGNDLGAIGQELEKLAALAAGRTATPDDVAALLGVRRGATLDDLVGAALERRPAAGPLVQPVLEQPGMTGVRVVATLGTALVGTSLARAELDHGAPPARLPAILLGHLRAARPYGLGSWEATAARWTQWAALWRALALRRALGLALAADRALKSTTVTGEQGILERLVLAFAVPDEEAA